MQRFGSVSSAACATRSAGPGGASGDAELTLLPEPMSTALLGLGLLGAGLMRRRARR
jgi:hypothetical protein